MKIINAKDLKSQFNEDELKKVRQKLSRKISEFNLLDEVKWCADYLAKNPHYDPNHISRGESISFYTETPFTDEDVRRKKIYKELDQLCRKLNYELSLVVSFHPPLSKQENGHYKSGFCMAKIDVFPGKPYDHKKSSGLTQLRR